MIEIDENFRSTLAGFESEFEELNLLLLSVEIVSDNKLFEFYRNRKNKIENIVCEYRNLKNLDLEIEDLILLFDLENDNQEKINISAEIEKKKLELKNGLQNLKKLYVEFNEFKNELVKIEITQKNGNAEFVQKLKEIFLNFAQKSKFDFQILKDDEKSKVFKLSGFGVYEKLKFFTGIVKFVENCKETEVLVVVLKDENQDIDFDEKDIEITFSKSSGAGGQHINKTESAVKIEHIPTGVSAECQAERSQVKNKEKAINFLKEKLKNLNEENAKKAEQKQRKLVQNIIFGNTPILTFDFDKNKVISSKTKIDYDIVEICSGKLENISNDLELWNK